jgi:hypothetical protein
MHIFYPVIAMVALTAVAVFRLGYLRFTGVRDRQVDPRFYRTYQGDGEPEAIAVVSRHVINLFESPVLFYVGVIVAYLTGQTGGLMTTIAWMYVVTRITHSWIHMTSNIVLWRFRVFISSWIVLLSMWTLICIGLLRAT